jgi:hypothetical protein
MKQTIEERQAALDAEKTADIDAYVTECANRVPGVPYLSVRNSILGNAHGCLCQEHKIVQKRRASEAELAIKQQAENAL